MFTRGQVVYLQRLSQEMKEKIDFYFVYISEAHPEDLLSGAHSAMKSTEEPLPECAVRLDPLRRMGLTMTALEDTKDQRVEHLYHAWPTRLVIIQPGGRILYSEPLGGAQGGSGMADPGFVEPGSFLRSYLQYIPAAPAQ